MKTRMQGKKAAFLKIRYLTAIITTLTMLISFAGCQADQSFNEQREGFEQALKGVSDDAEAITSETPKPVEAVAPEPIESEAPAVQSTPEPTPIPTPEPTPEKTIEPTPEPVLDEALESEQDSISEEIVEDQVQDDGDLENNYFDAAPGVVVSPVSEELLSRIIDLPGEPRMITPPLSQQSADNVGMAFELKLGIAASNFYDLDNNTEVFRSIGGWYMQRAGEVLSSRFPHPADTRLYFDNSGILKRVVYYLPLTDGSIPVNPQLISEMEALFNDYMGSTPSALSNMFGDGSFDASSSSPYTCISTGGAMLRYWYTSETNTIVSIYKTVTGGLSASIFVEAFDTATLPTPEISGEMSAITVRELSDLYAVNEIAAESQLSNKSLMITGNIQSVRRDASGRGIVTLQGEGGAQIDPTSVYTVVCGFSEEAEESLLTLEAGRRVTIIGMMSGLTGERAEGRAIVKFARCRLTTEETANAATTDINTQDAQTPVADEGMQDQDAQAQMPTDENNLN